MTEEPPSSETIKDAGKPFDASAKADVILRSSDSVDFYVMKVVLSLASSVFDAMFLLHQGEEMNEGRDEVKNGLPIIQLEEGSATLCSLLQLVYPYAVELESINVCMKVGRA